MESNGTLTVSPPPGQLFFSGEVEQALAEQTQPGQYTAADLRRLRPVAYEDCVKMLEAGYSIREVARTVKVHHRTVARVRDDNPERIDTARSKEVDRMRLARDLILDLLIEDPDAVPPNVRGLAIVQLTDKIELLSGRPTGRLERVASDETPEQRWVNHLRSLGVEPPRQLTAGEVREIGLGGEETPAIGDGVGELGTDTESEVSAVDTRCSASSSTSPPTSLTGKMIAEGDGSDGDSSTAQAPRRGGDACVDPGEPSQSHSEPSKFLPIGPMPPPAQ